MIRKLRWKFIFTNMALVSLVLLVVFAVLVATNSQRITDQSTASLHMALEWSGGNAPPRFEFASPPENGDGTVHGKPPGREEKDRQLFMIPVFCAEVDASGAVSALHTRDGVEVSDAVLEQAVALALASGAREGVLASLDLRFLLGDAGDGVRIAFADRGWERSSLNGLVASSLLVGLGALLGFFLISLFLSKVATRPVERAWEQQRQFVADASHELKTPLTVILANSGILLSHKEDTVAHQAKWVEYIQEEARRMKALVEDLLFLAKSDAARSHAARLPVELSEIAVGCLLPFESVAFEAGVHLESDIKPGLYMNGDESQLRRLILILLDNACKYAPQGGAVAVTLCRSQDKLRLTVHNTGPAIPQAHLSHLFERFYRSDSARSREAGGYGLGLAIAKSIVDSHRGRISVTSAEGVGTTFTVHFYAANIEHKAFLPEGKRRIMCLYRRKQT